MDYKTEIVEINTGLNMIIGQSHFIKTVKDIYEIIMSTLPGAKFSLAFCEASGPCLIRYESTDEDLKEKAIDIAKELSAGHCFVILMKDMYPINILNQIKQVPEVCNIFCATQNPVQVIIAETEQGRGILGVIDGNKSKGVESKEDKENRREFLRKIGYTL
ncbi:adenosine-specific kinase [Candidatus Micrarchaeota archaeon]|nr:adenosine-specific kinase [Candidatus Micrarchaeota archaeon]